MEVCIPNILYTRFSRPISTGHLILISERVGIYLPPQNVLDYGTWGSYYPFLKASQSMKKKADEWVSLDTGAWRSAWARGLVIEA